jgi:hypothetical protein
MRAIAPRTGAEELTFAEDQSEYLPVTIAVYPEYEPGARGLLWRFSFTPEEREAIAKGEDVYVMQLNFNTPMTPMSFHVGPHPSWLIDG